MKLSDSPESGILALIRESNVNELRLIRQNLGKRLHERLSKNPAANKLALNSGMAPGIANDALASNNGSSKYLLGGLVNYASNDDIGRLKETEAQALAEKLAKADFEFCKSANIEDCGLVAGCHGFASGDKAGKMLVYAGNKEKTICRLVELEVNEMPKTQQHRQAIQEASAILVLEEILEAMGEELTLDESAGLTRDDLENEPLIPEIREIETFNQKMWARMVPLLEKDLKGGKISVGESFTAGILGQIFTSVDGATKLFDWNLNWYDPRLKQYVGVPARNVTDELIAEPETIAIASEGLLKKAPPSTKISLGTTGWANYWVKGKADYFSIGIASKLHREVSGALTAKVTVNSSVEQKTTRGRRQLTRHLGATTVMFLLAGEMVIESQENHEQFKIIYDELLEMINKHAEIDLKSYSLFTSN